MADRIVTHFKVGAELMNDIARILNALPAKTSRTLLNRIESPAECEPIFAVNLQQTPDDEIPDENPPDEETPEGRPDDGVEEVAKPEGED